jgi:hypothetical protein
LTNHFYKKGQFGGLEGMVSSCGNPFTMAVARFLEAPSRKQLHFTPNAAAGVQWVTMNRVIGVGEIW